MNWQGRGWTPHEIATLQRMVAQGFSNGEIGAEIGRTVQAVSIKKHALRAAGKVPGCVAATDSLSVTREDAMERARITRADRAFVLAFSRTGQGAQA